MGLMDSAGARSHRRQYGSHVFIGSGASGAGPGPAVAEAVREALATELFAMTRAMRRSSDNLNQLTRYAHIDRRRPDELPESMRLASPRRLSPRG